MKKQKIQRLRRILITHRVCRHWEAQRIATLETRIRGLGVELEEKYEQLAREREEAIANTASMEAKQRVELDIKRELIDELQFGLSGEIMKHWGYANAGFVLAASSSSQTDPTAPATPPSPAPEEEEDGPRKKVNILSEATGHRQ